MINDSTPGRWFKRVLWLGIIVNLALSFATIAAPNQVIEFSSLPPATPDLWPRFSGLLLVLLSVFYMPAGFDLDRYRVIAWLAVASRLTGVVFFTFEPMYRMLGMIDLVFFIPEGLLLLIAVRGANTAAAQKPGVLAT